MNISRRFFAVMTAALLLLQVFVPVGSVAAPDPLLSVTAEFDSVPVGGTLSLGAEYDGAAVTDGVTFAVTEGADYGSVAGNVLTGTAEGSVTVTVSLAQAEGDPLTATRQFTVTTFEAEPPDRDVPALTGISVTAPADTVSVYNTLQFTASPAPESAVLPSLTWSIVSGNASVSGSGLVTPSGLGSVTVKAASADDASVYGECTFTVTIGMNGDGTAASPYEITSALQLYAVRYDLSAHYKLMGDIAFIQSDFENGGAFYNDAQGWMPIANGSGAAFSGTFDGNSKTISGLFINAGSGLNAAGLFGYISSAGVVKDLTLRDVSIANPAGMSAGAVAGQSEGTVENCHVLSGSVSAATAAGGIAGQSDGTISKCSSYASVTASTAGNAGGIVGINSNVVSKCFNGGKVTGCVAGGISGSNSCIIEQCYNIGSVTAIGIGDTCTGGISGMYVTDATKQGSITSCYSIGAVSAARGCG